MTARTSFCILALVAAPVPAVAQTMLGPTPYLSSADSPFPVGSPPFVLETFEDHLLNVPGAIGHGGIVTSTMFSGSIIDSVDADDGALGNGACANCDSYFGSAGSVTFEFDAAVLGGLPKKVGIVWTDGGLGCDVTFTAFDANGVLLGTLVAPNLGDGSNNGTTGEDRFFGIDFNGGVKKITLTNSAGGIEADHLQYERPNSAAPSAYCTGKVNSLGCTPSISSTGVASATAVTGFTLKATQELNNKVGLVLYSEFGRDASTFGPGGRLCVKAPTRRSKGFNSGGNPPPNDCSGVFSIDFNAFGRGLLGTPPNPAPFLSVPGQVVNAQFWGRDPGFVSPNNFSLSNALEFTIQP